ncbi:hypothetical protein ACR3K2_18980 [Cryptosporidium serpentis]
MDIVEMSVSPANNVESNSGNVQGQKHHLQLEEHTLARGLCVATTQEQPSSSCGISCSIGGPPKLTHSIVAFTAPIPVAPGQKKLNSADELIGKAIIKQRVNEKCFFKQQTERSIKLSSLSLVSSRGLTTDGHTFRSETGLSTLGTHRSYTCLSSTSPKNIMKPIVPTSEESHNFLLSKITSFFNGLCSCPGFLSLCNTNKKIQTIEQETIPSDSDFAETEEDENSESESESNPSVAEEHTVPK